MLKAWVARLRCFIVRLLSTLPPEISFLGARLNQAQKCFSSGHLLISVPISARLVCAIESLIPWTAMRSTPVIRRICARVSTSGVFLLCEWGLRRGGGGGPAGTGAVGVDSKRGLITAKAGSIWASHSLSWAV